MDNLKIKKISPANMVNMGGFHVRQPLPTSELENVDPFLLLHHAEVSYKNSRGASESGVGPHPHRGFSPVSFVFKGGVHHRDSLGNDSIIRSGGVQWINSGKGIMHSERPPVDLVGSDEEQEFIQLWVNTPAKHKMDPPSYQGYDREQLGTLTSDDGNVEVLVVSGSVNGIAGPVETNTEVESAMGYAKTNGSIVFEVNDNRKTMIYLLDGSVSLNGTKVEGKNLIVFEDDGGKIELIAHEETKFLYLSGAPLKEPVSSYGPFVMNTQREIIEALNDAQTGKMGQLIEQF